MSLLALAQHLRSVAYGGSVPLDAATLTDGTGVTLPTGYDDLVRAAFGLARGTAWTLRVSPGQIPDPSGGELRITAGTSTFARLALTDARVDLRFTLPPGQTTLQVTGEIVLGQWRFATSFPTMRGYPFDQISYESPSFVFAAQKIDGYAAAAGMVELVPGLNFASTLRVAGLVDQVRRFVTLDGDSFPFFGTVDLTAPGVMPAVRVRAKLAGTLAAVGPLRVHSPFVELRVQYGAVTTRRSLVFVLGMLLEIGEGFSVDFTAQLLDKPVEMVLAVAAQPTYHMTPDALFTLVGGRSWGNGVPGPLRNALRSLTFKDIEACTSTTLPPEVHTLTTRVGSTEPLQLFDQFRIDEFDVIWVLRHDSDGWNSWLQFEASFSFYRELFDGEFDVGISTDLQIWGSYTGKVSLIKLLQTITGGAVVPPSNVDFEFTDFAIALDIPRKSYSLFVAGEGLFDPLGSGVFVLNAIQLTLSSSADTAGRRYDARLAAMLVMAGFPLGVQATYATRAGWDFVAAMPPGANVSIRDFLKRLFPSARIPRFLDSVLVSNVQLIAHTGGSSPRSIETGATLQLRDVDLGPLGSYTLDANAMFRHVASTPPETRGSFSFGTTIPGIGARVTIGYAFSSDASQVISVIWGAFQAGYDITKSVLRFSVGEATLGDLLGQIVGLVIGEDGYRLPAPWSVLNELSLRGFEIRFDLGATPRTVSVNYTLSQPIHLGFLTLRGLSIGKLDDKITVSLDATFVGGAPVPAFDPLDKPPDVPGGSPIDLRLLALGQRVTVTNIEKATSINEAIKLLASFPDTPRTGLPAGPRFNASSPWLVGLRVLFVGSTVEIEIVFVDPLLYGMRIHLAGDKASVFENLDFEILYKRVTDTIGVYQIRLTLPDSMRNLQFGALAITLPTVGLDVYTSGDFRIDFGFPYNNDFSRSFGLQYFPFTGAGGFYFAKLSSATSTRLPTPSRPGTFDPVIEFGLGLRLGLGKDISAGVLKAGVSLTVFGIVEGVIATWNPTSSGQPALPGPDGAPVTASSDVGTLCYYRVTGTIGIIGKIYGSIDFAVVKADLQLTVIIALEALIEAHQPFVVAFVASVDVALTVKIGWGIFSLNIHLSFSMTVRESFTLGSATSSPWGSLGQAPTRPALSTAELDSYVRALSFAPFAAAPDDPRVAIDLVFVMQPTVAGDPGNATTTTGKLVAMLYLDAPHPDTPPPAPLTPSEPLPPAPTSFERFAETVFVWAVAAFGDTPTRQRPTLSEFTATPVTRTQVAAAYEYLSRTTTRRPISYADDIVPGLYPHLRFTVTAAGVTLDSVAPFPMIPELRLVAGGVNRRFADGIQVDDAYLANLRTYFETIAARYQDELEKKYGGLAPYPVRTVRESDTTSYSAAIVEDIVLMLARGMLRAGLDAMDRFAYPYAGESLSVIAGTLAEWGNTVGAAQIGAANDRLPLTVGVSLSLADVTYQLAASDTFAAVITRFGITAPGAVVADERNAHVRGVLRTGVTLTTGTLSHTVSERDTFADIAALPGWSADALAVALAASDQALVPLSVLVLPAIRYLTGTGDTLAAVADALGLTPAAVATGARDVAGLFADPQGDLRVTVPHLDALPPELILGQLRAKETTAHLAGANARFLLYGMRPPAPEPGDALGPPTALYELNSQQIDIPTSDTATLSIDAEQDWITFSGGPTPLSVEFDLTAAVSLAAQLVAAARAGGVPAKVEAITALSSHHDAPRRFTSRCTSIVQPTEPLSYPFDSGDTGLAAQPRLWFVPSSLARALAEPRVLRAAFTLEATSSGNPPPVTVPRRYGWATLVDVQVKRRTDLPATYEVVGSDEAGTAALRALIDPAGPARIAGIALMIGANPTGQAPQGYLDPGLVNVRAYLVKTNLSTETNPRGALHRPAPDGEPARTGLLNDPLDFARLLWEASVTRSGGFMLTYRRSDGSGLPEALFAGGDTATLTVLVLHAAEGALVHPAVNAVLVGDGFDPAHYQLTAVSSGQRVDYRSTGTESLASLTADYRIPLTTLAEAAATAVLDPGVALTVSQIVHQVRAGSLDHPEPETLDDIAAAYNVTPEAIIALNPGVPFDPLPALTLLRIPDQTASGATLTSLAAIRDRYGVDIAHLAVTNAAVRPLFAPGQTITFTDQLIDRVSSIPPGNIGFTLTRQNPGTGDTDPTALLGAQYNLLGFGVTANVAFNATVDALPVGPTTTDPTARTRAQLHAAASEPWCYEQVVYVAGAAKGSDGSHPYAGIDGYAQIGFAPRDMFGNLAASVMTQPTLGPAQPPNAAPFRVAYTDPLIGPAGWPSTGVDYRFSLGNDGTRVLRLAFTFDSSPYTPTTPVSTSTDPNDIRPWQQRALADLRTYRAIRRQLAAPGVTISVRTTLDGETDHPLEVAPFIAYADAAVTYLTAVASGGTAPPPIPPTVEVAVEATNADDLFALRVHITIARPAAQVGDAFRDTTAAQITSAITPQTAKTGDGTLVLTRFARDLETAYALGPVFLKVATGRSQDTNDDAVWIIRLRTSPGTSSDPGIGFTIPGPARYYAPRPLANVRISRGDVPILTFNPTTGIDWSRSTPTAFTAISLDTWGWQALAALDRFLSPDFAGAAFLVDHVDPNHGGYLDKILAVKEAFASGIAATVTPILTQPPLDPSDGAPLADATETMRQQILARAENAYVVSAICQYTADVSSRYVEDPASDRFSPRFYGPLAATPTTSEPTTGGPDTQRQNAHPWSLTVARPKLARGKAFVTTAITVVDPAAQSHLPLNLAFTLSNIEHDISRGVDGDYLASSWLSLVIPFPARQSSTPTMNAPLDPRPDLAIGDVDIPVVLREVPPAPSLVAQQARPVDDTDCDPARAIEQAKRWNYTFTYEKDLVAQDTIDVSVQFNLNDPTPPAPTARELDLFDHLARFITVWPAMLQTMIEVLNPDRLDLDPASGDYRRARTLIADFHQLLAPMPTAWRAWRAPSQRTGPLATRAGAGKSHFNFSVQEQEASPAGQLWATRTLDPDNTATVWDPATGKLIPLPPPELTIKDGTIVWTGQPVSGIPDTFRFVDQSGNILSYRQATSLRRRQPVFSGLAAAGLDVAAYQNAWSSVRVFRNRDLVRGPAGIIPTSADFIYATPEIKFASRTTPRLQRNRLFNIAAMSDPPVCTLHEHLQRVLNVLFEGVEPSAEQLARLDAEYEQTLGTGLPPAVIPIFLGTATTLTTNTLPGFVTAVSTYITTWFSTHTPPDGTLRFTLTLFPTLSSSRLPLLQMTGLRLARRDASDL